MTFEELKRLYEVWKAEQRSVEHNQHRGSEAGYHDALIARNNAKATFEEAYGKVGETIRTQMDDYMKEFPRGASAAA